ncbi:DMT family transporter [Litorimonas sp. RW-G-Af-16]|uniref:DMT family transporter n=1 Tax=Litorimonas sp. RW-G-Af-16 TaxID=3241168 RepID=UPI003AAAB83F
MCFMFPFLFRKLPQGWPIMMVVCACVGPIHLGFLYTGLQTAPASGGSIVSQMLIPFATLLSIVFLKERIGKVRGLAIIGALIGVIVMIYETDDVAFDIGLVWIICAYLSLAVGSVLMKFVGDVDWRQYVFWMAVMIFIFAGPISLVFESGHAEIWQSSKWPLLMAAGYAAVFITLFAHGQYFNIVRRYEVSQVVPLTLMTTVFACILGVVILKETIYLRYYLGAALILPCVYIIARRQSLPVVMED